MNMPVKLVDFFVVSPAIALFILSLLPLCLKIFNKNREPYQGLTLGVGVFAVFVAMTLNFIVYNNILYDQFELYAFSMSLRFDGAGYFISQLFLLFAIPSMVLCSHHNLIGPKQFAEFIFLMLSSLLGMLILTWANDMILLFIGIELMSLPLYIMVLMSQERKYSKEAALKYFVLGSVASAFLLLGMGFLYGASISNGETEGILQLSRLKDLSETLIGSDRLFFIGTVCVLLSLSFKVALFPFQSWSPDVYEGSSTSLTYYMIVPVKIASVFAFSKIVWAGLLSHSGVLQDLFQWLAVLTMLIGSFGALSQKSIKRVLAYSSISHTGYLMMALLAQAQSQNMTTGTDVIFYLFGYGLLSALVFVFLVEFENKKGSQLYFDDLNGWGFKAPLTSISLLIGVLGIAGIPPFVGFFGKVFVFKSAIEGGLYWLAFWGLLNSVIAVFYYLKVIVHLYLKTDNPSLILWTNLGLDRKNYALSWPGRVLVAIGVALALASPVLLS